MITWEYPAGSAIYEVVALKDRDGAALAVTGNEALAVAVNRGDDTAAIAMPGASAAWVSAPAATAGITLAYSDTSSLSPGDYPVYLTIGTNGAKRRIAILRLSHAPGSAVPGATYCTLDRMLRWAGDLAADLQERADQSGYAEQRHAALLWTHDAILARADAILARHLDQHAPVVESAAIEIASGVDDGPTWGPSLYPDTSLRDAREAVRGWLDDGHLVTAGAEDERMLDANALHALWLVYLRSSDEAYRMRAGGFRSLANRYLASWTARFDTDEDGTVDRVVESI